MNWKKIFHLALPLIFVSSFALLPLRANSYVYTNDFKAGHYWQSYPIGMTRFAVDASEGALLEDVTRSAEDAWESVVGKNIWDLAPVVLSTSYTGNSIRWSNNFGAETGYDPNRTLAVTIRYAQGTYLQKAVIILNGSMPQLRQNWGGVLTKTVLHEMGHVIGLDHTSEHAIMAAYISELSTLQQDDIAGANAVINETLYRQATGYVAPVSTSENQSSSTLLSSCGTIDSGEGGSGGGPLSFAFSLSLGVLAALVIKRVKRSGIISPI